MTIQKHRHQIAVHLSGYVVAMILIAYPQAMSPGYAKEIRSRSSISSAQNKDHTDITTRFQSVEDKLSQMGSVIRAIEEKIPSLMGKIRELEDPAVREKQAKLMCEHRSLQEKLESLHQQVVELKRALESRQSQKPLESRAELEQEMEKATEEKRILEEKLRELESSQAGSDAEGCPVFKKFSADKRPRYVMIHSGRVAPLEKPYYASSQLYMQMEGRWVPAGEERKRVKEGEPVSMAIMAGGCFDQLLSKLDPKEYVSFLVCTDSIASFRVAVESVRSRKIPYTWRPEEDRTFILVPGENTDKGVFFK